MHTSNFAKRGEDPHAVSISRWTPRWLKNPIRKYIDLAPSASLLNRYKQGLVTQEEYTQEYIQDTLSQLDPFDVYEDLGENAILCCYEKSTDFCHRHIVAKWLSDELGIAILEI